MEIKNLQDLQKLIKLCRKNGLKHVKIAENEISFDLGSEPPRRGRLVSLSEEAGEETGAAMRDDILFFSSPDITQEGA